MEEIILLIICIIVLGISYVIDQFLNKFDNKIIKYLLIILLGIILVLGLVLYSGIGLSDDAVIENQVLIESLIPFYLSSILGVVARRIKK